MYTDKAGSAANTDKSHKDSLCFNISNIPRIGRTTLKYVNSVEFVKAVVPLNDQAFIKYITDRLRRRVRCTEL